MDSWFYIMMGLSLTATFMVALRLFSLPALAVPAPNPLPAPQEADGQVTAAATSYWLSSIKRQGRAVYGAPDHRVFRNVQDPLFGAKGDGVTDDTDAINRAISFGNRCGQNCDSSTVSPALVYFPPGVYIVSRPIIQFYYTQLVGDLSSLPVLKAAPSFQGMAVIDADPYDNRGNNWYTNQNNFFRQIRNFVIDLRAMPFTSGAGIHWQVAQATSLQNIVFEMRTDGGDGNVQQGIFMDNGSGGLMVDLTFNGGKYGAFLGNQQFTTRNLTFNNCRTAIFMNWNWAWTFHDLKINNCGVGIDMANGGASQTVGSVLVLDSKFTNVPVGVITAFAPGRPETNGTLILDNVDFTANVGVAVQTAGNRATLLPGNQRVGSWIQGRAYDRAGASRNVQGPQPPVPKPAALLDQATGMVATRSKPQYENVPVSRFISVRDRGAIGNGVADDSDAIQRIFDAAGPDDIVYFDHGAYLLTKTIRVPKDIKITGEMWPLIFAGGSSTFKDQNNPQPLFRVGNPGDVGTVEMSDLMIETQGPQPGAILMEWNVAGTRPGAAGLWDVHFRVGGTAGTQLQSDRCAKNPNANMPPNPDCIGAFMLFRATAQSSAYLENTWFWVSDHELDLGDHGQINIYNGRGVLIESTKGTWLWGTSSEHNVLYNYQITNAANVYMALIQTETAYFQGNPDAIVPFTPQAAFADPNFAVSCAGREAGCARTWGVRVTGASRDVFVFGAGLYSFFDNYSQTCLQTQSCQAHMVSIEDGSAVHLYGISTKASVNMLTLDGRGVVFDRDNRNNFCATLALFSAGG